MSLEVSLWSMSRIKIRIPYKYFSLKLEDIQLNFEWECDNYFIEVHAENTINDDKITLRAIRRYGMLN
jgi:hypothetical protein